MASRIKAIEKLVSEMSRLPGIGARSAERIAYYILEKDAVFAEALSSSISNAKKTVTECKSCYSFADVNEGCIYCDREGRNRNIVCVVEKAQDVVVLEKSGYKGLYHVLKGLISPLEGVGPDDVTLAGLIKRINDSRHLGHSGIDEVIIALSPSVEGDATTMYIAAELCRHNVRVSKLARGVPAGASIDYLDEITICRAIEDRQTV
jgi:recombination protein RecR